MPSINHSITTLIQNASLAHNNFNLAMSKLDSITQMSAISVEASPPTTVEGDIYLVSSSPSGDWSGQGNTVAYYYNSTWYFITPTEGMQVYIQDKDWYLAYNGSNWVPLYINSLNGFFLDPSVGMVSGNKSYTLDIASRSYKITEFHAKIHQGTPGNLGSVAGCAMALKVNGTSQVSFTFSQMIGNTNNGYPLNSSTGLDINISSGDKIEVTCSTMEDVNHDPPENVRVCVHFKEINI